MSKKNKTLLSISFLLLSLIVTTFNNWEPGTESLLYWLYNKLQSEVGGYTIISRAPLYVTYLSLFNWLENPLSIIIEYLSTSVFVVLTLFYFFNQFASKTLTTILIFLWLPFIQVMQPPVYKIAICFCLIAIMIRKKWGSSLAIGLSYFIIILSITFRPNFLAFLVLIIAYDLYKIIGFGIKSYSQKNMLSFFTPVLLSLIIIINFSLNQSDHKWNHPLGISSKWLPKGLHSMGEIAFITNMNIAYVKDKYGSFHNKDYYHTNEELFNGASTIIGAISTNPSFIFNQIIRNIYHIINKVGDLSSITRIYNHLFINPETSTFNNKFLNYFSFLLSLLILIIIVYGSYKMCKIADSGFGIIGIFFVSLLIVFFSATVFEYANQSRRLIPLFPLAMFASLYYTIRIKSINLSNIIVSKSIILFFLILFSPGLTDWRLIAKSIVKYNKINQLDILSEKPFSPLSNAKLLENIITDCKGVMVLEHKLIGGLTNIDTKIIYDVYEIPPYDTYYNSNYSGLKPERIDCVLISHVLKNSVGSATNFQLRYDNYIKPYSDYLITIGAEQILIPNYGEAILLK